MLIGLGILVAVYIVYLIIKWSVKIGCFLLIILIAIGIFYNFKMKATDYYKSHTKPAIEKEKK